MTRVRECALAFTLLLGTVDPIFGQDDGRAKALRSLSQLTVLLSVDSDAMTAGVDTIALRTSIELELRRAGIRVLDESTAVKRGAPTLAFGVVMLGRDDHRDPYVYSISLELWDEVILVRTPKTRIFSATTWDARKGIGMLGYGRSFPSALAEDARRFIDEFLNDYWKVNPPRSP